MPFDLLSANQRLGAWFTADELIELYRKEANSPRIIDLTGGQPDLVPEWILWTMRALRRADLDTTLYLWSDDNLSNDYYFQFLSAQDREEIRSFHNYGRVCCFKGFDAESFSFNTMAQPELFEQQFVHFEHLLAEGLDLFAYVTLTTPSASNIKEQIPRFLDRLQQIHPNLPLRTVPLEIQQYTPMQLRMNDENRSALRLQWDACEAWCAEVESRFSSQERQRLVVDVPLRNEVR